MPVKPSNDISYKERGYIGSVGSRTFFRAPREFITASNGFFSGIETVRDILEVFCATAKAWTPTNPAEHKYIKHSSMNVGKHYQRERTHIYADVVTPILRTNIERLPLAYNQSQMPKHKPIAYAMKDCQSPMANRSHAQHKSKHVLSWVRKIISSLNTWNSESLQSIHPAAC